MSGPTRIERALAEQLARRGAEATPPPDAWARFSAARARTNGQARGVAADAIEDDAPIELRGPEGNGPMNRTWWIAGLAAAAAVLVVLGIVVTSDDDSPVETADDSTAQTVEEPPTSADEPVQGSSDEALAVAVAESYFDAFAAGDVEAIMALLDADVVFTNKFGSQTRDEFEVFTTWQIASEAEFVGQACSANEAADSIEVVCTYAEDSAPGRAVGAPPVENTTIMVVVAGAITSFANDFGPPDYLSVNIPFKEWVAVNHPGDEELADCCGGDTIESAQSNGELRARYAPEWAAYLEANDCTYYLVCLSGPAGEAIGVAGAYFDAYEAGDVDGIMALFAPGAEIASLPVAATRDEFEVLITWDVAQGATNLFRTCSASESTGSVEVTCVYRDLQSVAQAVGAPPVENTMTLVVINGAITSYVNIFGQPDYNTVNTPFDAWMAENHPEDAEAAACCGGDTVVEAASNGALRASYSEEWAAYLEAKGCTYDTGC